MYHGRRLLVEGPKLGLAHAWSFLAYNWLLTLCWDILPIQVQEAAVPVLGAGELSQGDVEVVEQLVGEGVVTGIRMSLYQTSHMSLTV